MLRALACSLLAIVLAAPASAYELVTLDGRVREADSVQFAGELCFFATDGDSSERLEASQIDYYETFRRNAEVGSGNVIVFRTGAFFRFETVEITKGRVVLGLGDQGRVTVPEQVVDFEQSVREAATIRLPRANSRVDVAKASSGGGGGGEGRAAAGSSQTARGGARSPLDRARQARGVGRPASGPGGSPADTASRRAASLRGSEDSNDADVSNHESPESFEPDAPFETVPDPPSANDEEPVDQGSSGRDDDGMTDPDEVRRRAEERGEQAGTVSVIVSSGDSMEVAGVQFQLRYPPHCSPAGAQTIGAFANASLSQPNGAVQGRQLFAMAIVYAVDRTTSLPGQIARVDFTWTGTEPSGDEFLIVSASASDPTGNAIPGFSAEASILE